MLAILDARYIRQIDLYQSLSYGTLAEVPQDFKSENSIMLTALKAVYHELKVHPGTIQSSIRGRYTSLSTYSLACLQLAELTR